VGLTSSLPAVGLARGWGGWAPSSALRAWRRRCGGAIGSRNGARALLGHMPARSERTVPRATHVKIKGVYTSKKTPQYSGVLRYTIAEYEGVNRLFHI
jgi:hypothetical protein